MANNIGFTDRYKGMAIYKWTLRKYMPFSVAYWILLFMSFPLAEICAMITVSQYNASDIEGMSRMEYYITGMQEVGKYLPGTLFATVGILYSVILTIMAFSYMHNKGAVDLFGSFPVSRRTLFFARFMAVVTSSVVPIVFFGIMGSLLTLNVATIIIMLKTVGMIVLGVAGNICFVAFISLCCGTTADVIVSYVLINIVYPVCALICYAFPKSIIPGVPDGYAPGSVFTLFCPLAATYVGNFGRGTLLHIVWWVLLSIILIFSCSVLCKNRKAETAQNAFSFAAVEIVIKFITCFAAGFGGGWILAYVGAGYDSVKAQYLWFFAGLILGIMVANILLHLIFHRGLSGYKKSLIECGAVFLTSFAFLIIVSTGAFGFDVRIPDESEISEVNVQLEDDVSFTINGKDILEKYSNDSETISDTVNLHEQIVEIIKKSRHHGMYSIINSQYGAGINQSIYDTYYPYAVSVTYKLKSGKTMSRTFYVPEEALSISKSLKSEMSYGDDNYYILQNIPDKYIESFGVGKVKYTKKGKLKTLASMCLWSDEENWNQENVARIVECLIKDMEENGSEISKEDAVYTLGIDYWSESGEENVSCNIDIPSYYENTTKALEDTGYSNVVYISMKGYYYSEYESMDDLDLEKGRTIYFRVPDSWDSQAEIRCMLYAEVQEEGYEDYEDIYQMTGIEDSMSLCEKVSGNIWKYTIKVPEEKGLDYYNQIMFYQITDTEAKTTGRISLDDEEENNLLEVRNPDKVTEEDFYVYDLENDSVFQWIEYDE